LSRPLIVALHEAGGSARDFAEALHPLNSVAELIALDGTEAFDAGATGRQWFSGTGVTDDNRLDRVRRALPPLLRRMDRLAARLGIARETMLLLGFGQGAAMALAAAADGHHRGSLIAIAGRLAGPVAPAPAGAAPILILHDRSDPVMPPVLGRSAADRLIQAGYPTELVMTKGCGHAIGPTTLRAIAGWLARTHLNGTPGTPC
jgi:phospholipase/carboxylesterase